MPRRSSISDLRSATSLGHHKETEPSWEYGLQEERAAMRRHEQIRRMSMDDGSSPVHLKSHRVAFGRAIAKDRPEQWQKRQAAVAPALPALKANAPRRSKSSLDNVVPRRGSVDSTAAQGVAPRMSKVAALPDIVKSPEAEEAVASSSSAGYTMELAITVPEGPSSPVGARSPSGVLSESARSSESAAGTPTHSELIGATLNIEGREAIISRDDGSLGFMVRDPEDGSHVHMAHEEVLDLVRKLREDKVAARAARAEAHRMQLAAQEEQEQQTRAAIALQAVARGYQVRNAKAKNGLANVVEDQGEEEDGNIEQLWKAIDARKRHVMDSQHKLDMEPPGTAKDKEIARLRKMEAAIAQEEEMVKAIEEEEVAEEFEAGRSALTAEDLDSEAVAKQIQAMETVRRRKMQQLVKKRAQRRRKHEEAEAQYWRDIESTRLAAEEQRKMQKRGSIRGVEQQGVSLDHQPRRRNSVEGGWGLVRETRGVAASSSETEGAPPIPASKAVLKLAAGMARGTAKVAAGHR